MKSGFLALCFVLLDLLKSCNSSILTVNTSLPFKLVISPVTLDEVPLDGASTVRLFYQADPGVTAQYVLRVESANPVIADAQDGVFLLRSIETLPDTNATVEEIKNMTASCDVSVKGLFLGYTELDFYVCENSSSRCNPSTTLRSSGYQNGGHNEAWSILGTQVNVTVVRKNRPVDDVFRATVFTLVVFINVAMGCKVDLEIVKEVLRKPVAPAIGFCCQFALMPVLSFAVVKLAALTPGEAMGVFTLGCAPGGGASNIYTYLVLGDISLSITMTLISTVAALGMVPFWMFTLGSYLMQDLGRGDINIPYTNILLSLAGILIPVAVGVVIQRKAPRAAKMITKIIRPFLFIFLFFMFTFGVWVNYHTFRLFNLRLVFAGMVLPVFGFTSGGVVAAVCRLSWKRIKTIALETGIQNTGVAIILLLFSLPPPENDFSIIGAVAVSTFTPVAPLLAAVFYEIRRRIKLRKKANAMDSVGVGDEGHNGEEREDNAADDGEPGKGGQSEAKDTEGEGYKSQRRRSSVMVLKF